MIVNAIIFIIVMAMLFRNFKFGVTFIAVTSVWLTMWRTPFMGSIYVIPAFTAIVIALLRYGGSIFKGYPFKAIVWLPFVSLIATNIFKGFDIYPILKLSVEYLFPVVLYYILKTYEDLQRYMKVLTTFLILLIAYTIFEEVTVSNPIMDWCMAHESNFYWFTNATIMRFGFKRAQSFLLFCSALGGICNFSFFTIAYLRYKGSPLVEGKKYKYLLYALPVCSFLTGTRSVYIPLFIMCLGFAHFNYIKKNIASVALIIVLAATVDSPFLGRVYDSIINSDDSEEVKGSNANMREIQFDIATYFMMKSPIVGNGTHYVSKVRAMDERILGAESIWLPLMIEQGILGCACTALVFLYMIGYLYYKRRYMMLWMMLAFIVGKTISAMGGIGEGYYFVVFVFLLRCHELGAVTDKNE